MWLLEGERGLLWMGSVASFLLKEENEGESARVPHRHGRKLDARMEEKRRF